MLYTTLKTLHMTLAMLSFSGFMLRTGGQLAGAGWARGRVARLLPHLVDTALLVSALFLLQRLQWYPLQQPWLLAKLGGLLAYIGLGVVTVRLARNSSERLLGAAGASMAFAYMVSVAISKSPLPFI
ncbi:SirB2 family protein [Microbulbifer yueqingensis]|uniref:Uncharacterized membrane protein SirB2 n=1 Tax=Microbulbifer yueqingensis TaxID=658219 RepID=A0A1G8XJC7_9GAMM|nr:SirB2 family protein [Microbulbifer yueqingensis]SDJ90709.1 Uncharacterized membrane protein SirB2 [Microbulbifer yueqingensis]